MTPGIYALALGTILAGSSIETAGPLPIDWELICEKAAGQPSHACHYVHFVYDTFLSLADWLLRGNLPDGEELRLFYVVNGRIKFGNVWHFFSSGPRGYTECHELIMGLHYTLADVPHRLKMVNLASFKTALDELNAMRDEDSGIEESGAQAK